MKTLSIHEEGFFFSSNVEFVLRLRAYNRYLNMDQLCDALFGKDPDSNPFQSTELRYAKSNEDEIVNRLEALIKEICRSWIRNSPRTQAVYERIEKAVKASDIDFDFKTINKRVRHTAATFMNNAEVDDKTIESQLGHYNVHFTRQRYMNAQDKQIRREMDQLAAYMTAF